MADAAKAFGIVLEFLASVALLTGLGYGADWWQGTSPRYTLVGLILGLVVGFYRFVREGLRLGRGMDSKR
jgi:F0F1-type ATP synthase assembly protein I